MRTVASIIFTIVFLFVFHLVVNAEERSVNSMVGLVTAINQAQAGDTILLHEGQYKGSLTISKPVHLKGIGHVTIQGNGEDNVITILADGVSIENLDISGSGSNDAGIYVKSNQNQLLHNRIFDVFHGIHVRSGYGNVITSNQITSWSDPKALKGYGIYVEDSEQASVSENLITQVQDGLYISFSDTIEASYNQISKARYGVHTMDSRNVAIYGNKVKQSYNGAMIMQSNFVFIRSNLFYLNTSGDGTGIFTFDTFDSDFSQNMISGNYKGIYLENCSRNLISHNQIIGNVRGLELGEKSNTNLIYLNNFIKNTQQVVTNPKNKNQFNDEGMGNYWDDHRIVDLNEDHVNDFAYKSGDVFYKMTEKTPFLQIFFESPAIQLWDRIEQFTYIPADTFIVDEYPITSPLPFTLDQTSTSKDKKMYPSISVLLLFIGILLFTFYTLMNMRRKMI